MAQYSHPQPYSGLAQPHLGLLGQTHTLSTQGNPIRAPLQPEISLKITEYFFVYQIVKYVASMRYWWPSIPAHNPTLQVFANLSWVQGGSQTHLQPRQTPSEPQTTRDTPKTMDQRTVICFKVAAGWVKLTFYLMLTICKSIHTSSKVFFPLRYFHMKL